VPTTQSPEAPADESVARVVSGPPFDFGGLLTDGGADAAGEDGVEGDDVTDEGVAPQAVSNGDGAEDADAPNPPHAAPRPRTSARAAAPPNGGASPRGGSPRSARTAPPRTFPRAERPAPVPAPEHHHLPGWVRRDFARSRPPLADLLALLQGDARAQLQQRVDELTAGISSGKFSLAWQYPDVIAEGQRLFDEQRAAIAEEQRVTRALETSRRRVSERLRDASGVLTPDASARLQRALRGAGDPGAIAEVQAEADKALSHARTTVDKRRERQIERTRARLLRTLPRAAAEAEEPQTESWQDVLRRFAEEQQAAGEAG